MPIPPPPPPPPATAQRDANGRFLKGNKVAVGNLGGPGGNPHAYLNAPHEPKFKTPDELWAAFETYRADVLANPLKEQRAFSTKNGIAKTDLNKMRPLTIGGFLEFIDVTDASWSTWRKSREDLFDTIDRIKRACYTQKFEGAAAGLLNANIIARELGLADRIQAQVAVEQTAPKVDPRTIADRTHPDCTPAMLTRIHKAGLEPPLYSQEQIEAGFPFIPPKGLPDE